MNARVVDGHLVTSDGKISRFREIEFYQDPALRIGEKWRKLGARPQEMIVDGLQWIRNRLRQPVIVTSGVRTKRSNKAAGGSPISLHLLGRAADIKIGSRSDPTVKGWELVQALEELTDGGRSGRYGIYHREDGGHVHVDRDASRLLRRWVSHGAGSSNIVSLESWISKNFGASDPKQVDVARANSLLGW